VTLALLALAVDKPVSKWRVTESGVNRFERCALICHQRCVHGYALSCLGRSSMLTFFYVADDSRLLDQITSNGAVRQ
jgi:hypothetical protein